MKLKSSFVLFIVSLFRGVDSKDREKVSTYFSRKGENGELIDATDPLTRLKMNVYHTDNSQTVLTASLQARPGIVKNGHNVTVAWNGIESAKADDFIALYCPENAKDSDYIDYFSVTESPTYKQGSGEHSVQLTNLRTNCQFRYFKYVWIFHQELVAISNTVMFEGGPEMPLQIHLALTGDPTEMRVMWVSGTGKIFDSLSHQFSYRIWWIVTMSTLIKDRIGCFRQLHF